MGKKPVVHLRTYQGRELNYDSNKEIKNPMSVVKIRHNTVEWSNFMKWLRVNGYCKVEVARVIDLDTDEEMKDVGGAIAAEVKLAFEGEVKDNRTPEQIQIDILTKRLEEIEGGKKKKKTKKKEVKEIEVVDPKVVSNKVDIKALRIEYEKVLGKKPFPGWKAEQLQEKIKDHKKS